MSIRCLVVKQVGIVVQSWSKQELAPYYVRVRDLLHDAVYDEETCIRLAALAAFSKFFDTW